MKTLLGVQRGVISSTDTVANMYLCISNREYKAKPASASALGSTTKLTPHQIRAWPEGLNLAGTMMINYLQPPRKCYAMR